MRFSSLLLKRDISSRPVFIPSRDGISHFVPSHPVCQERLSVCAYRSLSPSVSSSCSSQSILLPLEDTTARGGGGSQKRLGRASPPAVHHSSDGGDHQQQQNRF